MDNDSALKPKKGLSNWREWSTKKKITIISITVFILIALIIGIVNGVNDEKNKPSLSSVEITGYYDGIYRIDSTYSSETRMNLYDFNTETNSGSFEHESLDDIGFWTINSYGTFTINYETKRISFNGYVRMVNGTRVEFSGESDIKITGTVSDGYKISFQMEENSWRYTFTKNIPNS